MKRFLTIILLCGLLSAGPAFAIKAKSSGKKDTGKTTTTAPAKVKKKNPRSRRTSQQGLLKRLRDQNKAQSDTKKKDRFIDKNNDGVNDRVAPKTRKKRPATARPSTTVRPKPKSAQAGSTKRVKRDTTRSPKKKRDPR
jgi:hypothetical protein